MPVTMALSGAVVRRGRLRPAGEYAVALLQELGAGASTEASAQGIELVLAGGGCGTVVDPPGAPDAAGDWAASGAMWLTGLPDGPPLVAPGTPATAARGAAVAVELLSAALASSDRGFSRVRVDGAELLGERAAIAGLTRRGDVSPGGSCRLVPASDGLLAVNLPRPDDVDLLPAWLGAGVADRDPWDAVLAGARDRSAPELADRAWLLGIPVGLVAGEPDASAAPWRITPAGRRPHSHGPGRVVDLSSMWAGPLCVNLLGLAGFEVVKVESVSRPDGARRGPAQFYDLMHGGHRSVALDFRDPADLAALARLVATADVVVESSRPRALEQLDLAPERFLADSPGTVWISITGYGRRGPGRNRVAFGDDAAAAAGLVARCEDGRPVFCGDALADPLSGVHAAAVGLAMWTGGCGGLVDVAMRDVVASTMAGTTGLAHPARSARQRDGACQLDTASGPVEVAEPSARPVGVAAAAIGVDNRLAS